MRSPNRVVSASQNPRSAFTLIELLVVIGIIALLLAILLPSLSGAKDQAASVKCKANLQHIGQGLVMYTNGNDEFVIPSYNLPSLTEGGPNTTGGPFQPLDGWGPILDRDKYVPSNEQDTNTIFFCPKTVDVEGMKDGQTGTDPNKPRGWTDWPLIFTASGGDSNQKVATRIPEWGFDKIIRVSYWINAYNPIGNAVPDLAANDLFYTASVGFGPDTAGNYIRNHRMKSPRSSEFITVSDGVYMGRQGVTRLGDTNSRIGYRHPGIGRQDGMANVAFADGHVEQIVGNKFPRSWSASDSATLLAEKRAENLSGPTVYSDAKTAFPPP